MKTLIVDDEPLARLHLRKLLESMGETVLGEAEDAGGALQLTESLRPDVLFLDIQLPGLTGIQMAGALQAMDTPPLLIFVTGYSEHALAAFELQALDYIVKPVAPERLAKSLARARGRLSERAARQQLTETRSAGESPTPDADNDPPRLSRLPIREDYAVRFIPVEEILCAVAIEKRVAIRTATAERRTYHTLTQLESLLPAERFLRIHDSCIVNIEQIKELHSLGGHSYVVILTNGLELPVSRSRYPRLQRRLGLAFLSSS